MAESAGGSRGAIAGRGLALALIGGLAWAVPDAARAGQIGGRVMLVNVKTEKCLTIAGGTSRANNVDSVQYDCDDHPSRQWELNQVSSRRYQIRNAETGKCLTIAGGVNPDNNVVALQYDCDGHPSRW